MAYLIDRAVLWLLAAFSAFCLSMSITDGRLPLAVGIAFCMVFFLRILLKKLPERRLLLRNERMRRVHELLHQWAIMQKASALKEIKKLLPDLLVETEWASVQFLQRFPDSEPLHANELLGIWKNCQGTPSVILLTTGAVGADAVSLSSELSQPSVRLIDSKHLTHKMFPLAHALPTKATTKKRRRPFAVCAAQFIRSIKPARCTLYMIFFLILYGCTRSAFYFFSSVLFFLQLALYFIYRAITGERSA